MGDWLPGAVRALKELRKQGKVVIYSLRHHTRELDDVQERDPGQIAFEVARVRLKLDSAGLRDIDIYPPDRGKPPGRYYIDDRAVRFQGNWSAVLREIEERNGER